jgi:O-antigen/teichoic acid export membrane protein
MSYTVAQNTTFLTAASILQKIVSFFYFTILARSIGVENTGQYFFALTFTTIFTVIADFGIGNTLTRESAKSPEAGERFVATAFWIKIVFSLLAYGLVVGAVEILHYSESLKVLIGLSGITMISDNLQTVFYSYLRARKNLLFEAAGMVLSQFVTLVLGGISLYFDWPLYSLIIAYTVPSFLNLIYAATITYRVTHVRFWSGFSRSTAIIFLSLAWPIAIAGILGRLYAYSDSLLMSKMVSATELGWWSVPYKMTFAFQFVAIAVATSIYPVISSNYLTDQKKVGDLIVKAYRYLFTISFPMAIGLGAVSYPVIISFYTSKYTPAVEVLRLLLVSLVFIFFTLINGAVLNAISKQKVQTVLIAGVLVINVVSNILLLPRYGIVGAAAAALLSNIVLWFSGFVAIHRFVGLPLRILLKFFNQTFWPAVAMGPL